MKVAFRTVLGWRLDIGLTRLELAFSGVTRVAVLQCLDCEGEREFLSVEARRLNRSRSRTRLLRCEDYRVACLCSTEHVKLRRSERW